MFPLHPRLTHFPIALLLVGTVFVLLSLRWWRDTLRRAGWVNLVLGWIALFPAIVTGLIDQSRAPDRPEVARTVNLHITGGIALAVIFGYALYELARDKAVLERQGYRRWTVVAALLAGVGLLVVTGELGGRLVYTLNVGRR